jgi:TATA element modulatory factor
LDIILADDDQASAKARVAEESAKKAKAADKIVNSRSQMVYQPAQPAQAQPADGSRPASRNDSVKRNPTSRLQERLARAVQGGGRTASSRDSSISTGTVRRSGEEKRDSMDGRPTVTTNAAAGTEKSADTSTKDKPSEPEVETRADTPTLDFSTVVSEPEELSPEEAEIARIKAEHASELHEYLEKIDALHAKVAYLSGQKLTEANAEIEANADDVAKQKAAEQEVKIAQLMQEGEKLSRTEMKHLTAIKKLRSRLQDEEKSSTDLRKRLERSEAEARDLRESLRATEAREKAADERNAGYVETQRQLESVKLERQDARREIQDLRRQLDESEKRADEAVKKAQTEKVEEQRRIITDLQDDLSNSRLEKRLVEDRVKKEMTSIKEEYGRQLDMAKLSEMELKSELQVSFFVL